MAKKKVHNPFAALNAILKGGKVNDLELFIRDPDVWVATINGAHFIASITPAIDKTVHDEIAVLLEAVSKAGETSG